MTIAQPAAEMQRLVSTLNVYAFQYYTLDEPLIPDSEYDAMYRELVALEAAHPDLILSHSPTQRVGDRLKDGFKSVEHTSKMLSLDNAFNNEEFEKSFHLMLGNEGVFAELKADGLAASLYYVDGVFTQAVSRGDGAVGEDITHTVRTIRTLPMQLMGDNLPQFIEIRGEVVFPKAEFNAYNDQLEAAGKKLLANPRNGAAGAIRNHDPRKASERALAFQAYSLGKLDWATGSFTSQDQFLSQLELWGFQTSELKQLCHSLSECLDFYERVKAERDDLKIEIDGVVFKSNRFDLHDKIGSTNKHPKWAVAYKLPEPIAEARLLDVFYQTGRSSIVTPVARIEPTYCGGVTISTASLFNKDHLENRMGLKVGDTVIVTRAGAVVPSITARVAEKEVEGATPYVFTDHCPSCGAGLVQRDSSLCCSNDVNCPAQFSNTLARIVGRDCLDIEGIGKKSIEFLCDEDLLVTLPDLFKLKEHKDLLMSMEGWGQKSVDKLLTNIENAINPPLNRFIYMLSITDVGRSMSEALAKAFGSFAAFECASDDDLLAVDKLGKSTLANIRKFFGDENKQALLADLQAVGVAPQDFIAEAKEEGAPDFTGKSFVVTGTFSQIARKEIEAFVKANGGKVSGTPSAKTYKTIVGEKAGSKLAKSQELGLPIITDEMIVEHTGGDINLLASLLQ